MPCNNFYEHCFILYAEKYAIISIDHQRINIYWHNKSIEKFNGRTLPVRQKRKKAPTLDA